MAFQLQFTCVFLIISVQVFTTAAQCPAAPLSAAATQNTFMSPGYPSSYARNTNCGFGITALSGQVIHIQFVDMDLYDDACKDKIEFFNGTAATGAPMKTACGEKKVVLQSTGQNLFVRFTADDAKQGKGFAFLYWSAPAYDTSCQKPSSITVGSTPVFIQFPQNVTAQCEYKLTGANADDIIIIDFHQWDSPATLACDKGLINVFNGDTKDVNTQMIRVCGPDLPFSSMSSSGQNMFIHYTTSLAGPFGFYIRAKTIRKNGTCDRYPDMLLGPTPSYMWFPVLNDAGTLCPKKLMSPKTTVRATVMASTTVAMMGCTGTRPFTSDGMDVCVDNKLSTYSTTADLILTPTAGAQPVLLKVASFEPYCNYGGQPMEMMAITTAVKEIEIEDIKRDTSCMRRIKASAVTERASLILESTLEDNQDCVYIYDGMVASGAPMARRCGTFTTEKFMSSGQYLTFKVVANGEKTSGKLTAKYYSTNKDHVCTEQNLLATRKKQTLMTPNYPGEYPIDADCVWRFVSYRPDFVVVIEVEQSEIGMDCNDYAFVHDGELPSNETRIGEFCGVIKRKFRGSGQTMLLTFKSDLEMHNKKGFKFTYYADNLVHRELVAGTDVGLIAGVFSIIVVFGGIVFIISRLCSKRKAKKQAEEEDRQPVVG